MSDAKSDLAIARAARLLPIGEIAAKAGIKEDALYKYGPFKAKITLDYLSALKTAQEGKLILVTAISPTPAGEGKTTTTIGLGDALTSLGKKTMICLREPSLGPCFGMKGGATGGGHAQVAPMDEINLHFTGDFHAMTSANNLLAAMIDNHIYWGNKLDIDPQSISFRRALDMNDRSLREVRLKLNNKGAFRDEGFDITVASEVMAVFCLAQSMDELEEGLGRILVARTNKGNVVLARDLMAHKAMTALLRDAFQPNLAQTLEQTPALIHGGPFANIAHGCNSLMATKSALKLADYVVTEAGFGADLGAEKFFDIKCRKGNLSPGAAVIVASLRALKMHGGVAKDRLAEENVDAVKQGLANLQRHVENVKKFGVPVVVAVNHFVTDKPDEIDAVLASSAQQGVTAHLCRHWAEGGKGAQSLATEVISMTEEKSKFKPIYADALSLADKMSLVAREIYRAKDISFSEKALGDLRKFELDGYQDLPVCMAKTQYSFSADPTLLGAPNDFTLHVRDVRLMAGAGFVTALCGTIMTMPGLPRRPAAEDIYVGPQGEIEGLF